MNWPGRPPGAESTPHVTVLHLVPAPFGGPGGITGGAERYALELARHMADVVPTSLVTFGDEAGVRWIGRLRLRTLGGAWLVGGQRSNPFALGFLSEIARARVVHCHQQHVVASSVAALTARLTGRRAFATELGGGGLDISAWFPTDRWFHGHLHLSEYSRNVTGHDRLDRAHVIGGGVDTSRFTPGPRGQRNGTVVAVGRLLPHKGTNDLIDALDERMRAEIIGREADERFVADLHRKAAGKRVAFRRECTDDDLVDAYRRASCVVQPSVYRDMYGGETAVPELLGLALLEAMACGAPCVCTAVGGLPEVVQDRRTGLVVPPNDPTALRKAIGWMLDHPDEAARMGEAGRERVLAHFTWPEVVTRCLRCYGIEAGARADGDRA